MFTTPVNFLVLCCLSFRKDLLALGTISWYYGLIILSQSYFMFYSLKFLYSFYIARNPKWWNKYSNIWIQKVTHIHVGLPSVSLLRNIGLRDVLKTEVGPKGDGTMCLDSILRTFHKPERWTCACMRLCRWKSPILLAQLALPLDLQA